MAKYEKKFSPSKANTAAAALFDFLADGTPRNREDVITAISAAIPTNDGETARETEKRQRATATNTIYVARRTGRLIQTGDTIALNNDIAAQWREFRGTTNTPAAEPTTPVVETTINIESMEPIQPVETPTPTPTYAYAYAGA